MKNIITVYERSAIRFIPHNEYPAWQEKALQALDLLESGKGKGSDFLGWLHLPSETDPDIISQIKGICRDWKDIELAVVIGIGGSYLGAKAVIEALSHSFSALMPSSGPRIVFAGQNIGEDYLAELEDLMATKSVACVVISKSGTTTEPAIAFRLVKQHLLSRYGKEEAKRRIVAITDKSHGALRKMVNSEGFRSFIIPANVGGRFSVFTPVGLLPIALAGIDIEELLAGALEMEKITAQKTDSNPAISYAALRNALYSSGKKIELLVFFNAIQLQKGSNGINIDLSTLPSVVYFLRMEAEVMKSHPNALFGTVDQICDELEARRERFGISYVTVGGKNLEPFAPVVARLTGK